MRRGRHGRGGVWYDIYDTVKVVVPKNEKEKIICGLDWSGLVWRRYRMAREETDRQTVRIYESKKMAPIRNPNPKSEP